MGNRQTRRNSSTTNNEIVRTNNSRTAQPTQQQRPPIVLHAPGSEIVAPAAARSPAPQQQTPVVRPPQTNYSNMNYTANGGVSAPVGGGGAVSAPPRSAPAAVRCPRCRRLLQPPAGHPRFLCPCGQMLMAPVQAQAPTQRVKCPQCQQILAPPQGAPIFRCPCGQHLRNPYINSQTAGAVKADSGGDDSDAAVASQLQRRADASWARKLIASDGKLHWIRLLNDAEESALSQLHVQTSEHFDSIIEKLSDDQIRENLEMLGMVVQSSDTRDKLVEASLASRLALESRGITFIKGKLDVIGVDYTPCGDDVTELSTRLFTIIWNGGLTAVFKDSAIARKLNPDNTLSWIPAATYAIDLRVPERPDISPQEILSVSARDFKYKHNWLKQKLEGIRTKWEDGHVRIRIRRSNLLDDSFLSIMKLKPIDFRRYFRFEFIGEPGVDAGGVAREWFQLVGDACFNVDFGLFEYSGVDNVCYQINPNSGIANDTHLEYFSFLGRLMAKALFDGHTTSAHLTQTMYKHFLSWPIAEKDLEFTDAQVYSSFKSTRECEDVSMLCLDFTTTVQVFGENHAIELKPNGANIELTNENRDEYLMLLFRHIMCGRITDQLNAFLRGFYDVIPEAFVSVFDYQELELLICGLPNINVDDWQANTKYRGEFAEKQGNHKVVKWFWQFIRNLKEEDRARFLQYATGTSRVPVQGFAFLQGNDGNIKNFTIEPIKKTDSVFPRAHTCFNRIDLPLYDSYEEMERYMTMVISMDVSGFSDQ